MRRTHLQLVRKESLVGRDFPILLEEFSLSIGEGLARMDGLRPCQFRAYMHRTGERKERRAKVSEIVD